MRKPRGRGFRAFERVVLGAAMTVVAFVIERRLLKAIKKGGIEPAPRTAAEAGEEIGIPPPAGPREGELASPHQIQDQSPG